MKRLVLTLLLVAGIASAADWPQWLGARRDGGTSEKVAAWKDAPNVAWRVPVGNAYSSPVVAGGRVFVHAVVKGKQEEAVTAFDAVTGKEVWSDRYQRPAYKSVLGTGPRATPTVSGKRLFTIGINGVLSCYDAAGGKRAWQVDLYKELKADLPPFGVCCSPLVVGDRVIVSVGGKGHCVVALAADTGKLLWQALDDPASTSSAVLFAGGPRKPGAAPDVVFMTPLRVVALDPLDGTLRWDHPMVFQPAGTSPTPVIMGDTLVASTQAHGAVAVRVAEKDEKAAASAAWQTKSARSYFSSGVTAGGLLFLVTNTLDPTPDAALTCLDAKTGKQLWTRPETGYFHAAVVRTGDGKLLVLNDAGKLTLLEADASGAKELASAKVSGGTLVAPAFANGRLYVRDGKELICLDLPK